MRTGILNFDSDHAQRVSESTDSDYRIVIFSCQDGSKLDQSFRTLHQAVAARDLVVRLLKAISDFNTASGLEKNASTQLGTQLLWIWTFTSYRDEQGKALDEEAFRHLYTAFQQSNQRDDEALDLVAWADRFWDQVLVPNPGATPPHVTNLITCIRAWAKTVQQPQQPQQAAPQQLLPLDGAAPDRGAIPDLRQRSVSPDLSDHLQNPEQQQSAYTGQFCRDTEGSDHSELPHGPSCLQAEAAPGRTQDAGLGAHTVRPNAGPDTPSATNMPNQYVQQRTPVRVDHSPFSIVHHTAAPNQAMSLPPAAVAPLTVEAATVPQPPFVPIDRVLSLDKLRAEQTASQSPSPGSPCTPVPASIQPDTDCYLLDHEETGIQSDQLPGRGMGVQSSAQSVSRKRDLDSNLKVGAALANSERTGGAAHKLHASGLLQETSSEKGDLAYWRPRCVGTPCMQTGEIALIRDGQLRCILSGSSYQHAAGDQFAIISDRYVRWKGGRLPSAEEAPKGHWCAALGQLPVMVTGSVDCSEFIVASLTDPPMGQSLATASDSSARQRAVAFTLAAKQTEAPGPVMAFVLFALPAISQLIKTEVSPLQSRVEQVAAELQDFKQTTAHQVEQLGDRLKELELSSKAEQAERELLKAQLSQYTADIAQLKLAHSTLLPSPPAARLTLGSALAEASPFNETIIGQNEQLRRLLCLVADSNNKRNIIIIIGFRGMGKSTLATAFQEQLLTNKQVAYTFCADLTEVKSSKECLLKVLSAVGGVEDSTSSVSDPCMAIQLYGTHMLLAMQESRDTDVVFRQICSLLQTHAGRGRICLVFDNAEDLISPRSDQAQGVEAALSKILECVPSMVVVITSRETPQFLKLVPSIHLVRMTRLSTKDAQELLCLLAPGTTPVAAELLAAECGHIPYVINVIGKSMYLKGISAEDMTDRLREAGFAEELASEQALADMKNCAGSSLQLHKPNRGLTTTCSQYAHNTMQALMHPSSTFSVSSGQQTDSTLPLTPARTSNASMPEANRSNSGLQNQGLLPVGMSNELPHTWQALAQALVAEPDARQLQDWSQQALELVAYMLCELRPPVPVFIDVLDSLKASGHNAHGTPYTVIKKISQECQWHPRSFASNRGGSQPQPYSHGGSHAYRELCIPCMERFTCRLTCLLTYESIINTC